MAAKKEKSFKNWTLQDIDTQFGTVRAWESDVLDRWLAARPPLTEDDHAFLADLRAIAFRHIEYWNEAELKFYLISVLVNRVDFISNPNFFGHLEKTLTLRTEKGVARGFVNLMVATGANQPRSPYYLLHEYKPEPQHLDPKGQLLIAMLAAQRENEKIGLTQPVYGTFVTGRFWFLVVLNGNKYTISKAFDCTEQDDLLTIFQNLKVVKEYIENLAAELAD